jgi:hypothetical protein
MAGRIASTPTHIPNYFRKSRLIMLNIKLITAIVTSALLAPILSLMATPATAQILFGNVGSEPVSGIVGSGSKRQGSTKTVSTFDPTIQSKINAASAGLTPAAVSGTQTVLGKTVITDPAVVQIAFDLINSPAGANTPAVAAFAQSLGNSPNAQNLATSMQGLRNSDGSIDASVMTNAVNAYNAYVQTLSVSSIPTSTPSSTPSTPSTSSTPPAPSDPSVPPSTPPAPTDPSVPPITPPVPSGTPSTSSSSPTSGTNTGDLSGLPPGQKVAQVLLGKLLEAAR